jgi:starch synthase (maltosyl-transferring)
VSFVPTDRIKSLCNAGVSLILDQYKRIPRVQPPALSRDRLAQDSPFVTLTNNARRERLKHIVIEAVAPIVDGGRYPVKRIVGEYCAVEADIFGDSPASLAAVVKWRRERDMHFSEAPMTAVGNDRWQGRFPLLENTRYVFTIEAWTRRFDTWSTYFQKKVAAILNVASDLEEGLALLDTLRRQATNSDRILINTYIARISAAVNPEEVVHILSGVELRAVAGRNESRNDAVRYHSILAVTADRPRARYGAWYEIFPRSFSTQPGKHGTFRDAESSLHDIKKMGFNVVYLTPVHPIGITFRKGQNNSLVASTESPGSPWAIGASTGGHTAIEPRLGTIDDFDHFVSVARHLGLEVALDLAIQCSPDHPWVTEHPEWFRHRPDGTIKYAENPPKQYQDIYPLDFDSPDQKRLVQELFRVVLFWIEHGVNIFRVDNPHTKPAAFWEWLIGEVQRQYPEVLFLAEAFTRPKLMRVLAKAGFTQSYTYFTWRNTKAELTEYLTELTQTEMVDYFRPNFFPNTPDILPPILQTGGPPAFKTRLVLAATLSPSYGIYSGYELFENEAIPGTEEYAHSEKYELKTRDWSSSNSFREFISRLNAIRDGNPALQQFANLRFLETDNDHIIFYFKWTEAPTNQILIAVNLDPHNPHHCTAYVPPDALGLNPGQTYEVTDLIAGDTFGWGQRNYIRLDPQVEPAHILRVNVEA